MTLEQIRTRIAELDRKARGRRFTDAEREAWNALNAQAEGAENARSAPIACASWPAARRTASASRAARRTARRPPPRARRRWRPSTASPAPANSRRRRPTASMPTSGAGDPLGLDARYLTAVGDPAYATAFGKILADPTNGHLRHEPAEVEAMRAVARVETERAAMAGGADATGGFALPLTLDPSILLSSSGALNPIRQLARVLTITTRQWQGVSSDGVVASLRRRGRRSHATTRRPSPGRRSRPRWGARSCPSRMELGDDCATLTAGADAADRRRARRARLGEVLRAARAPTSRPASSPASRRPRRSTPSGPTCSPSADVWALEAGRRQPLEGEHHVRRALRHPRHRVPDGRARGPLRGARDGGARRRPARPGEGRVELDDGGLAHAGGQRRADDRRRLQRRVHHRRPARDAGRAGAAPVRRQPPADRQRGIFARWRTGAAVVNRAALRYLNTKP